MMKLLQVKRPGQAVARLQDLDLLSQILPEVLALMGVEQSPPHDQPVFEHTLAVMDWSRLLNLNEARLTFLEPLKPELQAYLQTELAGGLSRRTLLSLVALLHDLGKPSTFRRGSDQRIRFWNYAHVGADLARAILTRWRVSNQATRFVVAVIEHQLRPLSLAMQPSVNRRAIHRFLVALEGVAPAVALFALVDHLGTYGQTDGESEWQALTDVVFRICQAYFAPKPPPLLDGQAIMAQLQLPPGPIIGHILAALREAQAVEQVTTSAEALAFITQLGLERGWLPAEIQTPPTDDGPNG
jgi:tRNA nucleotidyltransferase/poly(A) polymerase